MSLQSSADFYRRQQTRIQLAVAVARGAQAAGAMERAALAVAVYQAAAAQDAEAAVALMLAEQAIAAPPAAPLDPSSFAGITMLGFSLLSYLAKASSPVELAQMVATVIRDTGRVAQGVAITARPQVDGFVRYLNPPSCARCTILAGRVYRWSEGFLRHDNCDCVMQPVTEATAAGLITDPMEAFRRGLIGHYDKKTGRFVTDLTEAETQAIHDGADIASVVNVQRKSAGLSIAGRVITRNQKPFTGGRLTPEGIYHLASDRDDAVRLLRQFGFLA